MSRTVYPAGGGYATYDSITLSAYKDWEVMDDAKYFDQTSNTRGILGQRMEDMLGAIKIAPRASLAAIATQVGIFMPYLDPALVGTVIYPSSDLPVIVQTKDGRSITYYAGAVTKPAPMTFATRKHLFGDLEIGVLIPQALAVGAASSYGTETSSAYTEPNIADSDEYYGIFSLNFGTGPTAIIPDEIGIVLTNQVKLTPIKPGMEPTRNMRITEVSLEIEFVPLNITGSAYYSALRVLQGSGAAALGGPAFAGQITIADTAGAMSGGLSVSIPSAAPISGGVRMANDKSRVNTLKFKAQQTYNSGWQPLATFTTL